MPRTVSVNTSMNLVEWGMLLALSVLWGGSFFFNGVAVRELPIFTIVVCRVSLAAITLLLIMRIRGLKLPMDRLSWKMFFSMGVLNNVVPFSLIVWGQSHIASGLASILNAATPLFTVVVAHYLTRDEKMTAARLLGVIIGFAGVAIMIGEDVMQALATNVIAQLACLGAALSYAFATVYGRRFSALGVKPLVSATGQLTAASLVLLPLVLVVDQPWQFALPGGPVIAALAGLALLSTTFAYIMYFRILATAGATNIAFVTFLIPVSAILLGVFLLDELLLPKQVYGMAIIGLGLAIVDGRLWWMFRARLRPALDQAPD